MADIFDMADTWNNGATTFTAIKMDVTDTASAAASKLLDLLAGGVSRFTVGKDGGFAVRNSAGNAVYQAGPTTGALDLASGQILGWWSAVSLNTGSRDLILARDAANTLAQRNGSSAQSFRIYNTYTNASNYERGFVRWSANVFEIGTGAAGTGSTRKTSLVDAGILMPNLPTTDPAVAGQLWSDAGTLKVSAG